MLSCVMLPLGPWWLHYMIHSYPAEDYKNNCYYWVRVITFNMSNVKGLNVLELKYTLCKQILCLTLENASCGRSDSPKQKHLTYYFQPSANYQRLMSAHFCFYARGATANSSAAITILTLRRADSSGGRRSSPDGWTTYILDQNHEAGQIPFHLHINPRPAHSPRRAEDHMPWSPLAIDLLQRPSQESPQHKDCGRAEIQISFQELGWDGVPGSMMSLGITTTSDGGYSFQHEILPNIIPEKCTCI
uniref:Uncharacterized protein n=1 Tax=Hippocampus comes TaxID=109280 RepID=A0A3Q2XD30_HIPCM